MPPSPAVLHAFGVAGEPVPLAGGEGRAYSADAVVLKPADDEVEAAWIAGVFSSIEPEGLRLPRAIRVASGDWVAAGW